MIPGLDRCSILIQADPITPTLIPIVVQMNFMIVSLGAGTSSSLRAFPLALVPSTTRCQALWEWRRLASFLLPL